MATAPLDIKISAFDRFTSVFKKSQRGLSAISGAAMRVSATFQTLEKRTLAFRNSMRRTNQALMSTGKTMALGVTLPIAGMGVDIIRTAANFEKSMNKVKALTGDSGEGFVKMTALAKELGATTRFSASEAADAMSFLGMAGWETNQILKATPALLDLAAASNTDLARTADIASNIMGAFQIEASGAGRVADVLAAVTSSANVDMEMLAESMKFMGPVAKDFGMSLEEAGAAAGVLGNIGIQGTMAGTAMRRMMSILTAPTDAAAGALDSLGVKVADSQGNIRKFNDIMADLGDGLGKLPQKAKMEKLNKIFGLLGISAASNIEKVVKTGEFEKYAKSLRSVEGRASEMAKTLNSGAMGAVKNFTSAMEGFKIAIADSGFLSSFTQMTQSITGFVRDLSKSDPEILKLGTFAAIGLAIMGPLAIVVSAVASAFVPIAGLITGIGIAFAGVEDPMDIVRWGFHEFKKLAVWLRDELPTAIDSAVQTFTSMQNDLFAIFDSVLSKIETVKGAFNFFTSMFTSSPTESFDVNAIVKRHRERKGLDKPAALGNTATITPIDTTRAGEENTLNVKFENPPPGMKVVTQPTKRTRINIDSGLQAAGGL